MVNVFFQATIDFNGFSMVLTKLDHHHRMFFEGPTIAVNGLSMVFKILRAMVNDGFEVNDGLDVPLNLIKCLKSIYDKIQILSRKSIVRMIWTIPVDSFHHFTV